MTLPPLLSAIACRQYLKMDRRATNGSGLAIFDCKPVPIISASTATSWSSGAFRSLDRAASMQGLMIYCGEQILLLAQRLGREQELSHLPETLARMKAKGRDNFFDAKQGVCVSGPDAQISWASQAWMVLGGCLSRDDAVRALRKGILEDKSFCATNHRILLPPRGRSHGGGRNGEGGPRSGSTVLGRNGGEWSRYFLGSLQSA
jgi:hypothetical protein